MTMREQNTQNRSPRQSAPEEPAIRTFPSERRRVPLAWTAWLMVALGTAALAAGGATAFGPQHSQELAWYAQRLRALGVLPGHLLVAGATVGGLGLVGLYVARVARALLAPGAVEDALAEVGADLAEFRNKLYEFENDHVHFRATLEALQVEVREHRQKDRSQEATDALFQMAGSLDTLHARFDQRLGETSRGVEQTLCELGTLVEASRDFLQESLEQSDHRVEALAAQIVELARSTDPAAAQAGDGAPLALAEPVFDDHGLDDEPQDDHERHGLGLLDELDDGRPCAWDDLSDADGPTRVDLEAPRAPLPNAGGPSHLERMQGVVREEGPAPMVEGLEPGGEPA